MLNIHLHWLFPPRFFIQFPLTYVQRSGLLEVAKLCKHVFLYIILNNTEVGNRSHVLAHTWKIDGKIVSLDEYTSRQSSAINSLRMVNLEILVWTEIHQAACGDGGGGGRGGGVACMSVVPCAVLFPFLKLKCVSH